MGRKTYSYDVDTRNEASYRFEQQQKNLGNQLGGVIFSEHPVPVCNSLKAGRIGRRYFPLPPASASPVLSAQSPLHTAPHAACEGAPAHHLPRPWHRRLPYAPARRRPCAVCNNRTYHTCMEAQMFGLPSPHWCYVQHVRAG